eukprot:319191-Rhodomonas_salina.2
MELRIGAQWVLLLLLNLRSSTAGISSKTLTHWYRFDSENGSFLLDSSGNRNTLRSAGSPEESSSGCAVGSGCATLANTGFNGSSAAQQYLMLPDMDFRRYGSTGISISAWYRLSSWAAGARFFGFQDGEGIDAFGIGITNANLVRVEAIDYSVSPTLGTPTWHVSAVAMLCKYPAERCNVE